MKRIIISTLVAAAALVFAGTAFASLPPPGSGTLELLTANPALGDTIEFSVDYPGHLRNPRVDVQCYQDVNGDGVIEQGWPWVDIVWSDNIGKAGYGAAPDEFYTTLGGFSSLWTLRGGGPATCHADLLYYVNDKGQEWNGGAQIAVVLDSLDFDAAG